MLQSHAGETPDNVTSGFVETFGVGVCAGAYSPALLAEWHRWDGEHGSENEPVDCFEGLDDQLFVVGASTSAAANAPAAAQRAAAGSAWAAQLSWPLKRAAALS